MRQRHFYDEKKVRAFLGEAFRELHGNGQKLQIAGDFWPALEARIERVLRGALRLNGSHRRITGGELQFMEARHGN